MDDSSNAPKFLMDRSQYGEGLQQWFEDAHPHHTNVSISDIDIPVAYVSVPYDGISPEEISADKGAYFENGIDSHSEDDCTIIKVKNKTVLKTFDSPEAAQLYSRNVSRMYNVKN